MRMESCAPFVPTTYHSKSEARCLSTRRTHSGSWCSCQQTQRPPRAVATVAARAKAIRAVEMEVGARVAEHKHKDDRKQN